MEKSFAAFSLRSALLRTCVKTMKKLLLAFDFDHTIIDVNSDIVIRKMIPNELIPEDVKQLYKKDGWTAYMQAIFNILHSIGTSKQAILKECHLFQPTPGMPNLIVELKKTLKADIIIISDSNTLFIEEWLQSKGLYKHVDAVYSNPASFKEDGSLEINMFHEQDWCKLSTKNLCKGHILKQHLEGKEKYDVIAYVGDGKNDLCPSLTLQSNDLIFARSGYVLLDAIKECQINKSHFVLAQVHPWNSGVEILDVIRKYVESEEHEKH